MKNTIRVERAIKDITQQDLALAVGVSRQTINSIESSRYVPSTVLALKIAHYFGKSVDEIFSLDPDDSATLYKFTNIVTFGIIDLASET